jgi:hypothetical protein
VKLERLFMFAQTDHMRKPGAPGNAFLPGCFVFSPKVAHR